MREPGREVMVASESVAIEGTGHKVVRDVAPGEALFIDLEGVVHATSSKLHNILLCPGGVLFYVGVVANEDHRKRKPLH